MENMQCNDTVDTALAELVGLQNRNMHYNTPGTTTISSSPSFGHNRKFSPHFSCQGTGISSASANQQQNNGQVHPKYISKILSSPRKASELPLFRMRPYFVPERSRTKSESLEVVQTLPEMCGGSDSDSNQFGQYPMFTTSTTNSASYTMMSSSLMDTTGGTSRSPGILSSGPSHFEYDAVNGGEMSVVVARGYSMEPRRMRLKKMLQQAMKKSKSLEDVRAEVNVDGSQLSHEMEFVSSRIQKLKVQEQE